MVETFDILAISGSLRKGSFNTALLRNAQALAPAGTTITILEHRDLPLYDGDLEASAYPAAATRIKERVRAAEALLFAVPEYNYSVPGVLKNLLDWVSRPYGQSGWAGKVAGILGTGGGLGTVRAQTHFRQIAHGLDIHVLRQPEIYIANAATKFDAEGNLTDETARKMIATMLTGLHTAVQTH